MHIDKRILTGGLIILALTCAISAVAGDSSDSLKAKGSKGASYTNPRLKELSVKSVVVLPPIVELTKNGVKGKEGMGKESDEAVDLMTSAITRALTTDGFTVDTPFTPAALEGKDDLKYAVADAQRKFDDVAGQVYRHHKDIKKGRFTLGDSVAVLNTKGSADALVFVRASGEKMTGGKGFLTGGLVGLAMSGSAEFVSHVALVDAKSGEILFLGQFLSSGLPKDKTYEKSFEHIVKGK